MQPIINYIHLTVNNSDRIASFYNKLMPTVAFVVQKKSKGIVKTYECEQTEYCHSSLLFAINSPKIDLKNRLISQRKPEAISHPLFRVNSKEKANQLFIKIKNIEAAVVNPPKFYPQHEERYCTLFLKNPEKTKYEIVQEER